MNNFPLYDKLSQQTKYLTIDKEYDYDISATINNAKEHHEYIYALMVYHCLIKGTLKEDQPCFGGKEGKVHGGIQLKMSNIDEDFRKILILYIMTLNNAKQ